MKEYGIFENSTAMAVEKSIEFAGRVWKPNRKLAYVVASFCHSLPIANSKRRGFTAATLANSVASATMQMFDFEHRLEFYGARSDEICGAIAAAEFPEKDMAMEAEKAGESVPMKILFAIWRKAANVEKAMEEMAGKKNPWRVSMECEFPIATSSLWDGTEHHPWSELSADEQSLVKPNTVEKLNGKPTVLVMGGENGSVLFTGGALTKYPADKLAEIENFAANEYASGRAFGLNCGWQNRHDWFDAVASIEVVDEKANKLVIAKTMPDASGHIHEIASDFSVLPGDGDAAHSHYLRLTSFDPNTGGLDGITNTMSSYKKGDYTEHHHKVSIRVKQSDALSQAASNSLIVIPKIDFEKLSKEIKGERKSS